MLKKMLNELGFSYLWNNDAVTESDVNLVVQRIYDHYLQQWCAEIEVSTRLDYYRQFKTSFIQESYLGVIKNDTYRKALARFRCSSHNLEIETGRHRNIARSDRICTKCNLNQVESEFHFLLVCPLYRELRTRFFNRYFYTWPNIMKFKELMSSSQKPVIVKLAKFIHHATRIRNDTV